MKTRYFVVRISNKVTRVFPEKEVTPNWILKKLNEIIAITKEETGWRSLIITDIDLPYFYTISVSVKNYGFRWHKRVVDAVIRELHELGTASTVTDYDDNMVYRTGERALDSRLDRSSMLA